MPAESKVKPAVRKLPYDLSQRRPQSLLPSPLITGLRLRGNESIQASAGSDLGLHASALPLAPNWDSGGQVLERPTDFINKLSSYLKSKNEAYKRELGNMEAVLAKAEETSKNLKETVDTLGKTVDALEDTMSAAANILSSSLICAICFETSSSPTSLKCGHSFCRSCLQSYFLSKFEKRCGDHRIILTDNEYSYIYRQAATGVEAEQNMINFASLSNRIKPDYCCPSCRDSLLPSSRNSFADFKLAASLSSLSALISYDTPAIPSDWKVPGIDLLAFLNSRFFRRSNDAIDLNI